MTSEELTRLEKLAAAATSGPWTATEDRDCIQKLESSEKFSLPIRTGHRKSVWHNKNLAYDWNLSKADNQFIAASRQAVPDLIAEVRRLQLGDHSCTECNSEIRKIAMVSICTNEKCKESFSNTLQVSFDESDALRSDVRRLREALVCITKQGYPDTKNRVEWMKGVARAALVERPR